MELRTNMSEVRLVSLTADDAVELDALLRAERDHLNTWSDHNGQVDVGVDDWREELGQDDPPLDFSIRMGERLVGRVGLISHAPRYGLGYWVAESACGRGVATAAVAAAVDYVRADLKGTDILAGVTHGNVSSVVVLERNGFTKAADFEGYSRYHLALSSEGLTAEEAAAL